MRRVYVLLSQRGVSFVNIYELDLRVGSFKRNRNRKVFVCYDDGKRRGSGNFF